MGDGQGNRRKSQLQQDEIEAQALEALERARMLPPGDRRHELLKQAGKLRMQAVVERVSDEAPDVGAKAGPPAPPRRRGTQSER
jgi:hypothetical protein